MRALGFVVIVPCTVAVLSVMARTAQRRVELVRRDDRANQAARTQSG